jgi:hypothetical protein
VTSPEPTAPTGRTLWTDDEAHRFYLVPDDVALGTGPLRLRAGVRHESADPAAVAPYEVSREEARAFLDGSLGAFVAGTRDSVIAKLGLTPFPKLHEPDAGEGPGPGMRLFADLAGEPPERIAGDPQAALDAFARMMRAAGEKLSAALRTPEGKQELREGLAGLGDTLRRHGIAPDPPPVHDADAAADPAENAGSSADASPPPPGEGPPADDGIPASPALESLVAELERAVAERRKGT